jgi:HEPN domain-containing protein
LPKAIEKSIKSVLAARNIEYPLTHDITRLLDVLRDQSIAFPTALKDAAALTEFAVRFRYDELPIAGTEEPVFDRAAAVALAALTIERANRIA